MTHIGDYKLIERIGAGGMGEVWRAENVHTHKAYAIKLLPEDAAKDQGFVARFFDEGRVMSDLNHPHIVRVHHVGHDEDTGRYYLVEDLVGAKDDAGTHSVSVHDLLEQAEDHRLPERDVRRWAVQVAEALAYAHEHGVVHRDIKPANVLIDKDGDARVTDFGLAKAIGEEYVHTQIHQSIRYSMAGSVGEQRTMPPPGRARPAGEPRADVSVGDQETMDTGKSPSTGRRTTADALLGTYDYMSPEQRGELPGVEVSPASDVYAFGVMIYRMLTGRRPAGRAKAVSQVVKAISKKWDVVVDKCLEHQPGDRYADGSALLSALGRVRRGGISRLVAPAVLGVLVLAGLGYGGYMGWDAYDSYRQRRELSQAQEEQEEQQREQAGQLVSEARVLFEREEYGPAGEKVEAALELVPGDREALKLQDEIRLKVGLEQVVPVKSDAEMALANVRGLADAWPGHGPELDRLEKALRSGKAYYEKEQYPAALEQYQAVVTRSKDLKRKEADRVEAGRAKAEADKARSGAEAFHAGRDGGKSWNIAEQALKHAEECYAQGKFAEAGSEWAQARKGYESAESRARNVREVAKARQAYEHALNAVDVDLDRYGRVEWHKVKDAASSAELLAKAERWDEAIARYRAARQGLPGAEREAAEVEKQERLDACLAAARRAREAEDLQEVVTQCDAALEIEPGNREAVELKQTAESRLAPTWKLTTTIDGREVPATIRIGSKEYTAPQTFRVEHGGRYKAAFWYEKGGKHYTAESVEVTVDWKGPRERQVALREVKGPKPGEDMSIDLGGGVEMAFVWVEALDMWVGKYEVTNGEYRRFKPGHDSKEYKGHSLDRDRQPVVYVNFADAKEFAAWMNREFKDRMPHGWSVRLPSEHEWMTFAQCGDGREYPWGDEWPPRSGHAGNYADEAAKREFSSWSTISGYRDGHAVACDVEQSWENDWGLYGVGGNVWECCADNSAGASFGAWRGASWNYGYRDYLRCSYRGNYGASVRDGNFGFRLVLSR